MTSSRPIPVPVPAIRLVPAQRTESDARLIMNWRNDPATRAASFDGAERRWEQFWPYFQTQYFLDDVPMPQFLTVDGQKVASIRFDRPRLEDYAIPDIVEISVHVAPEGRCKGYGSTALLQSEALLRADGFRRILALVKSDNRPSIALFEKVGYVTVDERVAALGGALPMIKVLEP